MVSVICLNCLLAVLVCWLAKVLWQWRCAITQLTRQLQSYEPNASTTPQQVGYALMQRRAQITEMRLGVAQGMAQWQQRSRQIRQTLQLIRILRTVLAYRNLTYRNLPYRKTNSRRNSD